MFLVRIKAIAFASVIVSLSALAFAAHGEAEAVANHFVRLYFEDDNLAKAVELASGDARAKLEASLHEIEEMKAKEPPADKPVVKAILVDKQSISEDQVLYYYRVVSDVEVAGMAPITAGIWVSKVGDSWKVSKFVQDE